MIETYTIRKAVKEVLGGIPYDNPFTFRDFYRQVLAYLHIHGNQSRPMDSSVSRIFRLYKRNFDVVLIDRRKSLWVKQIEN